MIGECASLGPRKNSLNLCNLIMSLIAGILMIVACASFSTKVNTVQNLSFMVLASGYDMTDSNGIKTKSNTCTYVGLQAACSAKCGTNSVELLGVAIDLPDNSPLRTCETGLDKETDPETYGNSLGVYADMSKVLQCDDDKVVKSVDNVVECATLASCISGGNVTMAFAVLGAIGALFTMVIFAWRMNGDGVCAKLVSVIFSTGTFVSCVTAFGAFQPCASNYYYQQVATATKAGLAPSISNVVVGVVPGVGGIMAVTSFVFFIYVMFMALFIPGANPDAAGAGLDTKA